MLERHVSGKETAPYRLSNNCEFVAGAKRAAIYNLETGNVYSLNELAKEITRGSSDKFNFWEKLKEMGLAEVSINPIALEMVNEVPQLGLEFMWLELTQRCNERCLHCYASAGDVPQTEELPFLRWEQIIEQGVKLGCRQLQFIGGEPLLFREIFDLVQTAKELDYEFIEIFTNGTLLNEEKIKKIKDLRIHVAVSLYSIVPGVHDEITQVPGSFQKTFKALEMLKEAQIPTRIGIIVMRQNQDTISETQAKLQEMGFNSAKTDVLRPTGRGSCGDLFPKNEVIRTLALLTKPDFSTSKEQFYRYQHWNSCWAGKIAVTSNGGIMPCIFARNHIVSSVERGLEEAINSKHLQNLWRITKDEIEGCHECEYRYACHDCRPLAEDTTGNLYAKNPRCTYNPLTGEWLEAERR